MQWNSNQSVIEKEEKSGIRIPRLTKKRNPRRQSVGRIFRRLNSDGSLTASQPECQCGLPEARKTDPAAERLDVAFLDYSKFLVSTRRKRVSKQAAESVRR